MSKAETTDTAEACKRIVEGIEKLLEIGNKSGPGIAPSTASTILTLAQSLAILEAPPEKRNAFWEYAMKSAAERKE